MTNILYSAEFLTLLTLIGISGFVIISAVLLAGVFYLSKESNALAWFMVGALALGGLYYAFLQKFPSLVF